MAVKDIGTWNGIAFKCMTPLIEQVVQLGVCPACHTKTLQLKLVDELDGDSYEWYQCSACGLVTMNKGPQ